MFVFPAAELGAEAVDSLWSVDWNSLRWERSSSQVQGAKDLSPQRHPDLRQCQPEVSLLLIFGTFSRCRMNLLFLVAVSPVLRTCSAHITRHVNFYNICPPEVPLTSTAWFLSVLSTRWSGVPLCCRLRWSRWDRTVCRPWSVSTQTDATAPSPAPLVQLTTKGLNKTKEWIQATVSVCTVAAISAVEASNCFRGVTGVFVTSLLVCDLFCQLLIYISYFKEVNTSAITYFQFSIYKSY